MNLGKIANWTTRLTEGDPEDQQVFKIYLNGVGNGFMFANARLELKGKPTLYCQPGGLTLNSGNYISLIEGVASRDDLPPSLDIEVMLLIGLEREFPCP